MIFTFCNKSQSKAFDLFIANWTQLRILNNNKSPVETRRLEISISISAKPKQMLRKSTNRKWKKKRYHDSAFKDHFDEWTMNFIVYLIYRSIDVTHIKYDQYSKFIFPMRDLNLNIKISFETPYQWWYYIINMLVDRPHFVCSVLKIKDRTCNATRCINVMS